MAKQTTPQQRVSFYVRHQQGETYAEIAQSTGVSTECVRYWCRRLRDGGLVEKTHGGRRRGLLQSFALLVRYVILRLRLEHPRCGPDRIRNRLKKRPSLKGLPLPSPASIGRYLHQWPLFRHQPKPPRCPVERPHAPTAVHQCWQVDFKMGIHLPQGVQVNLCSARDPVGEAGIGAFIHLAGPTNQKPRTVALPELRGDLRKCFTKWHTLPDGVQTDNEAVFVGRADDLFPSLLTLWLKGLDVNHLVIRPGTPTDNAEEERFQRTLYDYVIAGQEKAGPDGLQSLLDQGLDELNYELGSRAEGCHGQPPVMAHPELLVPRRPYKPEWELALFDLKRVDAYLATFTWSRKVGQTGQITIGTWKTRYSVGRAYAGQTVQVKFDPQDRHFVFYDAAGHEIKRRPAKGLSVEDITGLGPWPDGPGIQQLPLPLFEP